MRNWIFISTLCLLGCGPYPYWRVEHETEFVVETDDAHISWTWVYEPYYNAVELEVDLSFKEDEWMESSSTNVDLELVLPTGAHVTPFHDDVDDCVHFGNDYGYDGYGSEHIECYDPWLGRYEIRVVNRSADHVQASLSAVFRDVDYWDEIVEEMEQSIDLEPFEEVRIPLIVD